MCTFLNFLELSGTFAYRRLFTPVSCLFPKIISKLQEDWKITKKRGFNDELHNFYYILSKKRIKKNSNLIKIKRDNEKSKKKTPSHKVNRSLKKINRKF